MRPSSALLTRPRRGALARAGSGLAAGLAVIALAGCGSDDAPAPAAPSVPVTSSSAPPASPSEQASSPTPSSTAVEGNAEAVAAAAATAVDAVDGAVAVAVESEDENEAPVWQVTLVTESGDEQELDVSADGSEVVRTGRVDRQDAGDRRENRALVDALDLDLPDAVAALPDSVRGGTVDTVEADLERGKAEWEADVRAADGQDHEIRVDAASGDVISDRT